MKQANIWYMYQYDMGRMHKINLKFWTLSLGNLMQISKEFDLKNSKLFETCCFLIFKGSIAFSGISVPVIKKFKSHIQMQIVFVEQQKIENIYLYFTHCFMFSKLLQNVFYAECIIKHFCLLFFTYSVNFNLFSIKL